jgi:hypothetical protein
MTTTVFVGYIAGVLLIAAPFIIDTIKHDRRVKNGRR